MEAPLINYEYDNYRWINDFEFPVVVEAADADTYAINNTLIPQREEAPFAGYEDLLLDLIHVDPEYYRIDSVEWDTEPWTENGVVYRKATAKGSKLVADVVAYYEGVTVFESRRGYAVRSIYSLHEDSTIEQTEEPVDPIDQEKNLRWWEFLKRLGDMIINFIRNHPAISISIGLVILIFALILILHRLSKKKKEEKIKELQDFISRFSANASKSKQATSRKKALEKIQLDDIKPSSRKYPYIDFRPNREIGNDVLQVEGLTKTVDGVKILDNLSFTLGREDKVAFVGSNEQAITMLFKILTGEEEPDSGYYKWGVTTTQAYFPKDNTAEFDCDLTIADWLTQYSEIKDVTYVRGFLGRMLFAGEDGVKRVRVLSGGEKVRCLLSKMMISGANVLVLDEPTNHLDMESITALNNGLIKFPGVLLFTCHDHQFVQTTANRIMEILPNGALIDKMTTYDEYLASDEMARKRHVYTMTEEDN